MKIKARTIESPINDENSPIADRSFTGAELKQQMKKSSKSSNKRPTETSTKAHASKRSKSKPFAEVDSVSNFVYPNSGLPPPDTVKAVYEERGGKGKVTLEDVVRSVARHENAELKKYQGALQKVGDAGGVEAVCRARVAVKDVEQKAILELENKKASAVDSIAMAKQEDPKNKAMWADIAKMMEQISSLKSEEKLWSSALVGIEEKEKLLASGAIAADETDAIPADIPTPQLAADINDKIIPLTSEKVSSSMNDITLAADRIGVVLKQVNTLVGESDVVKKELYEKYKARMFASEKESDPKKLIKSLLG